DSQEKLRRVQQDLTLYLYENHRLVLSGAKTEILGAQAYVNQKFHNPYAEEKVQLFRSLEVFNPYTEDFDEVEVEVDDEHELLVARIEHILDRVLAFETLDVGLARSVLRRARRHCVDDVLERLMDNFEFFV